MTAQLTAMAETAAATRRRALPLWTGAVVYAALLAAGSRLLNDPDTFWQIRIGQWIIDNRALPHADAFSFTLHGQPWISTQWLAQVLYAVVFDLAGWPGPVVLAASAIALAFALLAGFLIRRLDDVPAIALLGAAFAIAAGHLVARPHALALPVMVAWMGVLLAAAERRTAPALPWVALMSLWVNLHGSFLFGLVVIAPVALDALVNAAPQARKALAARWAAFAVAALAASLVTPYGWQSLLAARNILNLGAALSLIGEWAPADFGKFGALEAGLLAVLGFALFTGARLPPVRIALFLGLLHMALSHVRNADVFALLAPMVLAAPLAVYVNRRDPQRMVLRAGAAVIAAVAALMVVATAVAVSLAPYAPAAATAPAAAVAALRQHHAARVFNDYDFGGYLIWQGVPTFIDGRTELFGETLMVRHDRATSLKDVDALIDLLRRYDIDATLLRPSTPAVHLLDRLDGWRRVYADAFAVVHVRVSGAPAKK
jgi:hypothetical protein